VLGTLSEEPEDIRTDRHRRGLWSLSTTWHIQGQYIFREEISGTPGTEY
jgi:hypothetical protein